jgi:hypothetical protein
MGVQGMLGKTNRNEKNAILILYPASLHSKTDINRFLVPVPKSSPARSDAAVEPHNAIPQRGLSSL